MVEDKKEPESALEIYVRFNDDMEKDYCLQVTSQTLFRDLFKVFETLPIALRPNLFYDPKPVRFVVLTAPGYLTDDGALLFSYETGLEKYQKRVSLDDTVAKKCWPGQLILPVLALQLLWILCFCVCFACVALHRFARLCISYAWHLLDQPDVVFAFVYRPEIRLQPHC